MVAVVTLKQFYKDLYAWVLAGMPEHPDFYIGYGLCSNLNAWSNSTYNLRDELNLSFIRAHLDAKYPFNHSPSHFYEELGDSGLYKNRRRLDWIKEHATKPY
jgi:hypothetical protein